MSSITKVKMPALCDCGSRTHIWERLWKTFRLSTFWCLLRLSAKFLARLNIAMSRNTYLYHSFRLFLWERHVQIQTEIDSMLLRHIIFKCCIDFKPVNHSTNYFTFLCKIELHDFHPFRLSIIYLDESWKYIKKVKYKSIDKQFGKNFCRNEIFGGCQQLDSFRFYFNEN